MKDYKSDSTEVLDRFARDKRKRTTTSERIERRPGPRRDADDTLGEHAPRRASYNPHFTEDNRPVDERPRRSAGGSKYGEGRSSGHYQGRSGGYGGSRGGSEDRPARPYARPSGAPRYGEGRPSGHYSDRSGGLDGGHSGSEERPARPYGKKPFGAPRYGEGRPSGHYSDRSGGFDGGHSGSEERPARPYGKKPFGAPRYGEGRPSGHYSDRSGGFDGGRSDSEDRPARPYGKKPFGGSKYGDKPAYGRTPAGKFGPKRPYGEGGERAGAPKRYGAKPAGGFKRDERRGEERPKSYPRYNPNVQTGEIRLNRFIAQSGLCSRREADDYIQAGLVSVNGVIVTELGTKVMPTDEVKFNDSRVEGEKKVYLVLNKPKGYVTSLEDPHADKTVMDLVKGACEERIYPVGRLDKNSLGLLLFTNDGDLTRQLTHPSYMKKKIYQVSLDKPLARADMDRIVEGVTLEDGEIHADEIAYVKEDKAEIGLEIHSGRNRIVRRIFESLGYTVKKLDRVYYAGLTKKNLKRGAWRFLTKDEVMRLKSGQYE